MSDDWELITQLNKIVQTQNAAAMKVSYDANVEYFRSVLNQLDYEHHSSEEELCRFALELVLSFCRALRESDFRLVVDNLLRFRNKPEQEPEPVQSDFEEFMGSLDASNE
jgi:hypothetical protein